MMILRTWPSWMDGPVSSKLDWVRLPPLLCMDTAAISAPAAMAETGMFSPK